MCRNEEGVRKDWNEVSSSSSEDEGEDGVVGELGSDADVVKVPRTKSRR